MYSAAFKQKAVNLRKTGLSVEKIAKQLGIAKSTASYWLRNEKNVGLYSTMTQKEWLNYIRSLSNIAAKKRRIQRNNNIKKKARKQAKLLNIDIRTKQSILAMLYWAEGSKGSREIVTFPNTDPELCLLFITLFRQCYNLDESKFRLKLHLQQQHNEQQLIQYWSKLLKVPSSQFTKTSWKKKPNSGKRYRKNYRGICYIRYNNVALRRELMAYAYAIANRFSPMHP